MASVQDSNTFRTASSQAMVAEAVQDPGPAVTSNSTKWRSLVLGQVISALITGTGVFSATLASNGVNIPTAQSSLNYVLLIGCLSFSWRHIRTHGLAAPSWYYILWALCDVEANYLVVLAYQYTSIASIMLLDCFAIPVAMLLSRCMLSAQYKPMHIAACLICVGGMALTVLSDVVSGKSGGPAPNGPAWLGDLIVLAGATLYGFSNVMQERVLKLGCSRWEALGMLGLWGSLISICQAVVLERHNVMNATWSTDNLLSLFGFQMCLFTMYILASVFLFVADAAVYNLSLLTSDVYSVIFSWLVQHNRPSWIYGVAFSVTCSGLVVYHCQPEPTSSACAVKVDYSRTRTSISTSS